MSTVSTLAPSSSAPQPLDRVPPSLDRLGLERRGPGPGRARRQPRPQRLGQVGELRRARRPAGTARPTAGRRGTAARRRRELASSARSRSYAGRHIRRATCTAGRFVACVASRFAPVPGAPPPQHPGRRGPRRRVRRQRRSRLQRRRRSSAWPAPTRRPASCAWPVWPGSSAGAFSMASGEYVSMQAQAELLEARARDGARRDRAPARERAARAGGDLPQPGVDADAADELATEMHRDPELALETHAREELGIDPTQLGSPLKAPVSSFASLRPRRARPAPAVVLRVRRRGGDGVGRRRRRVGRRASAWCSPGSPAARRCAPPLRQLVWPALAAGVTYSVGSIVGARRERGRLSVGRSCPRRRGRRGRP